MSQKEKGSNAERELIHLFWANGWTACRVAGSGSMHYPAPDIIAGIQNRKLAIECKSGKNSAIYLEKQEVAELISYANSFGAEPLIAVRFFRTDWFFLEPKELEETNKNFVARKDTAEKINRTFMQVLSERAKSDIL